MIRQLSLLASLLAFSPLGSALTLYVAPDGSDSSSCGTVSAPCKSIKRAIKTSSGVWRVGPGDTVLLKGGRYVVDFPLHDRFYVDYFPANRNNCLEPEPANSLLITVDPAATDDALVEMGESFADPLQNTSKRGSLFRLLQSNCVIVDGDNRSYGGSGKRLIFDGKERKFGLSNGYYDAYFGGPIPPANTPQPASSGLVSLVDYSGATATLPTEELIYGGVIVKNLEVRNTLGAGISFNKYRDVTIQNNVVHHTFYRAIGGYGFNVLIEGNTISNAAQINRNNTMFYARQDTGGWPGVLQVDGDYEYRNLHSRALKVAILNNHVQNSWGEGIIFSAEGGVVADNTVVNAYAIGIYLERGAAVAVERNHLVANDALYHRPVAATPYIPASSTPDAGRRAMDGVTMATEGSSTVADSLVRDATISNNVMAGVRRGMTYWWDGSNTGSSNSYARINFSHNVLVGITGDYPIRVFTLGSNVERHADNQITNNLIEKGTTGSAWRIGDASLWTLAGNYVFERGNYLGIGLAGPTFEPGAAPASYAVSPGGLAGTSATVDAATSRIETDFAGRTRPAVHPAVGAFEW